MCTILLQLPRSFKVPKEELAITISTADKSSIWTNGNVTCIPGNIVSLELFLTLGCISLTWKMRVSRFMKLREMIVTYVSTRGLQRQSNTSKLRSNRVVVLSCRPEWIQCRHIMYIRYTLGLLTMSQMFQSPSSLKITLTHYRS